MTEILYVDDKLVVCLKQPGVLSTDEPGGMPELLRSQLGTDNIRTVHRLDRAVGGVMVFARTSRCASDLSKQIAEHQFDKRYLAVIPGKMEKPQGQLRDILIRDKARRMTLVTRELSKDAREAVLEYQVLAEAQNMSLIRVKLLTGRTHQIRVQFSSRGLPLIGDRKYGYPEGESPIALWSESISFVHPKTDEKMSFRSPPPEIYPWTEFGSGSF